MELNETYYELLEVADDASSEEIKRAYRRLARLAHPDQGGSPVFFRLVQRAYDTLSDGARRRSYDQELRARKTHADQPEQRVPDPTIWGSDGVWDDSPPPRARPSSPPSPPWVDPAADRNRRERERQAREREQQAEKERQERERREREEQERERQEREDKERVTRRGVQRRRLRNDLVALAATITLCVLTPLPLALGRWLLRDTPGLHPTGPYAFQPMDLTQGFKTLNLARDTLAHYQFTDHTAGDALLLTMVLAFACLRGRGRLMTVGILGACLAVAVGVLLQTSHAAWLRQERFVATETLATPYPYPNDGLTCGDARVAVPTSTSQGLQQWLYVVRTVRDKPGATCQKLELWRGWERIRQVNLPVGEAVPASVKRKPAVSVKGSLAHDQTFTVQVAKNKTLTYDLSDLLRQR